MMPRSLDCFSYQGYVTGCVPPFLEAIKAEAVSSSLLAELAGLCMSIAIAITIPAHVQVTCVCDSKVAIGLASGDFAATSNREIVAFVRALFEVCAAWRGVALEWVKGHSGHPWNELADSLATLVSKGKMPCSPMPPVSRPC